LREWEGFEDVQRGRDNITSVTGKSGISTQKSLCKEGYRPLKTGRRRRQYINGHFNSAFSNRRNLSHGRGLG